MYIYIYIEREYIILYYILLYPAVVIILVQNLSGSILVRSAYDMCRIYAPLIWRVNKKHEDGNQTQ